MAPLNNTLLKVEAARVEAAGAARALLLGGALGRHLGGGAAEAPVATAARRAVRVRPAGRAADGVDAGPIALAVVAAQALGRWQAIRLAEPGLTELTGAADVVGSARITGHFASAIDAQSGVAGAIDRVDAPGGAVGVDGAHDARQAGFAGGAGLTIVAAGVALAVEAGAAVALVVELAAILGRRGRGRDVHGVQTGAVDAGQAVAAVRRRFAARAAEGVAAAVARRAVTIHHAGDERRRLIGRLGRRGDTDVSLAQVAFGALAGGTAGDLAGLGRRGRVRIRGRAGIRLRMGIRLGARATASRSAATASADLAVAAIAAIAAVLAVATAAVVDASAAELIAVALPVVARTGVRTVRVDVAAVGVTTPRIAVPTALLVAPSGCVLPVFFLIFIDHHAAGPGRDSQGGDGEGQREGNGIEEASHHQTPEDGEAV